MSCPVEIAAEGILTLHISHCVAENVLWFLSICSVLFCHVFNDTATLLIDKKDNLNCKS